MTLTDGQKTELMQPQSAHAILAFLSIEHSALVAPIRVVNDLRGYVRGGHEFKPCGFGYRLVTDQAQSPRAALTVANINGEIGKALEAAGNGGRIGLEILSTEDFDISQDPAPEIGVALANGGFQSFEIASVSVDVVQAEAVIACRDFSREPWPRVRGTQDRLPGLFFV